ncbi:MAG: acetyl-CoA hydrolase/transferase C-terminal domain-containing protein [Thermoanaerobacterales bacterium]|nr:acetyl-CoA hydrolase/transferase C-terminal domain-containing protein [Thermoanaerobacterales bacterium]
MVWFKTPPLTDDKQFLRELYQAKRCTPEDAVKYIESEQNIVLPLGAGEPTVLLEAMTQRKADLRGVRIHQMLPMGGNGYRKPGMERHFRHVAWIANGTPRPGVPAGRSGLMFGYFHQYPSFLAENMDIDIFMGTVSPIDQHGFCSFGVAVDYTTTAARLAKKVLLVVNPNMPRTHGTSFIHIAQADCIVEDDSPLPDYAYDEPDEETKAIAAHVAEHIPDGATIALGLGPIPQAVGEALRDKHGLGVHCDFLTDAIADLVHAGAVTNRHKTIHPDKVICTSVIGSRRLYRFVDDNPLIEMHPVSYTNDPAIIARNIRMTAIYTAGEVDLLGQATAQAFGARRLVSGGQVDFARGCAMAPEGRFFLVLRSRNEKGQSAIVPQLSPDSVVCVGRHDIDAVATEYGVAFLKGRTLRQRAEALIAIAHPNYRDGLAQAAKKLGLTR